MPTISVFYGIYIRMYLMSTLRLISMPITRIRRFWLPLPPWR
jgi:hypothetical protein